MTRFDPYQVAREILATTDLANPDDIAEAIFTQTPKRDIPGAYRAMLRTVAREEIRLSRMHEPAQERVSGPSGSSRVAGIREHHFDYYGQRVFACEKWKLLGDCTREDVLDLAAQRRKVAAQNSAVADEFEVLATRMLAAGVATVRDLKGVAA